MEVEQQTLAVVPSPHVRVTGTHAADNVRLPTKRIAMELPKQIDYGLRAGDPGNAG